MANQITGLDAQRTWLLSPSLFRTARKEHFCDSFELAERPTPNGARTERISCPTPIRVGERYVEYLGESAAYQSGQRYHRDCAKRGGVLIEGNDPPLQHRPGCRLPYLEQRACDPSGCACGGQVDTNYEEVI